MIAQRKDNRGTAYYWLDIYLQSDNETAFFDVFARQSARVPVIRPLRGGRQGFGIDYRFSHLGDSRKLSQSVQTTQHRVAELNCAIFYT